MTSTPEKVSIRDAAAELNVSTQRIYQLITAGKLVKAGPGNVTRESVDLRLGRLD